MENLKSTVEELTENITDAAHTYYKLTLLNITEKAVNVASISIMSIGLFFLLLLALVFGGIGLAVLLNKVLETETGGYFIVSGVFFLLAFLLIILRRQIVFPFFRNFIIKKAYD